MALVATQIQLKIIMNDSPYNTQYRRVLIKIMIIFIYYSLIINTIILVGERIFKFKILSKLAVFNNIIFEHFTQFLIEWSVECFIFVQESYVFVFFRDAG